MLQLKSQKFFANDCNDIFTIMTRKEALLKQGGNDKSINELWEKTKNAEEAE